MDGRESYIFEDILFLRNEGKFMARSCCSPVELKSFLEGVDRI